MSAATKIEWCDATVNHWAGCTAISPACDNCYAKRMAGRLWGTQWGPGAPRHQFAGAAAALRALDRKAQRLGRPLLVFHNSLSDFFDNEVPVQWRIAAMRAMLDTSNLIHLLLTKRIGNAAAMLEAAFRAVHNQREGWADNVPPNIWIGATIANQPEADRAIQKLLAVPAAKHFLSMEPLLGPVVLPRFCACGCKKLYSDAVTEAMDGPSALNRYQAEAAIESTLGVDWVIVGGESGPGARPMHPDWARSLRDQCQAAGVPFLFKQWGGWKPISQMEEAEHCALYKSSVTAKPHEDQANLDDIYGRKCTVPTTILHIDGSTHGITEPMAFRQGTMAMQIFQIGKKATGRLLDGRTWDGVPTERPL